VTEDAAGVADPANDMEDIITGLTKSDLCFSVDMPQFGAPWDVYGFWHDGRKKHVALRIVGDTEEEHRLELCFIDKPKVDEEAVKKILHARAPS